MPFFSLPPFPPTPGSELLITYLITISSPQLTRTSNRSKKPTAKAQECDDETKNDLGSQSKFYALHMSSFTIVLLEQEWCTILCHEDGRDHTVGSRSLEPEDSDTLKKKDLTVGNTLLWKVRWKRYTATLLEVSGKTFNC